MIYILVLACLGIGLCAGILSGMLGIGSGMIIVPAMRFLLQLQGVEDSIMRIAASSSLTAMMLVTCAAARAHWQKGNIDWKIWKGLLPGCALGVICGANIADQAPNEFLEVAFGGFMLLSSIHMFRKATHEIAPTPKYFKPTTQFSVGLLAGNLTGTLGIGGGVLMVPYIMAQQLHPRVAAGTTVAIAFPMIVVGSLTTLYTGLDAPNLPEYTLGYIYWPAALAIGLASLLTVKVGARWAEKLPVPTIKRLFATLMVLVACQMLIW